MTLTWSDDSKEARQISSGKGCPNTGDNPCKTGNELNCTPNVTNAHPGTKGNGSYTNTNGDAMAWYVGFVEDRGIGIHNSQTANGTPLSHGCVRVGKGGEATAFARKVNQNVTSETTITVTGKAPTKAYTAGKSEMKHHKGCPNPPEPPAKKAPARKRKSKN